MLTSLHTFTFRSLLVLVLSASSFSIAAQVEKHYFNKDWIHCDEANAKYYRVIEEVDTLLKVTDYYISGSKQSECFVENKAKNFEILKIRGDFEQKTIGNHSFYNRNGKLIHTINENPFHKTSGVDSKFWGLIDSLDTIEKDVRNLSFSISYFSRVTDYGFLTSDDKCHGTWVREHAKSGRIIKTARNYKEKLNGEKIVYYRSGIVKRRMPYKNDLLHGEVKKYNRKGILVMGKEYENGNLIETWLYKKPKKK